MISLNKFKEFGLVSATKPCVVRNLLLLMVEILITIVMCCFVSDMRLFMFLYIGVTVLAVVGPIVNFLIVKKKLIEL